MFWSRFLRRQCSCPGKNIEKKPAQGALPKSRPLENPPAAPPEVLQNLSGCYEAFCGKHSDSIRPQKHRKTPGSDCFRA